MTGCRLRLAPMWSPSRQQSATARQPVTKQESQSAPERDSYWFVELLPVAREKLVKNGAINSEQHGRWAHRRARASGNCRGRVRVMPFGEHGEIAAHVGKRRLSQNPTRRRCKYAVRMQQLARQVQAVSLRIPDEIAKYIGELQRSAEFFCDPLARRHLIAEYAQR